MTLDRQHVSIEYLQRIAELGHAIKQTSFDRMAIVPGATVLDVGCGPGVDTVSLAERVGETGSVWGVDADDQMIAAATEAARLASLGHRISHYLASANALPFVDAACDSARAERLLQVLPKTIDPLTVVQELRRVVRPGGRLVLLDTDWGSFSLDATNCDLERQLTGYFASGLRPNGFAGRQLLRLCQTAKIQNLNVEVFPVVHNTCEHLPLSWLVKEATTAAIASARDIQSWLQNLHEREAAGEFYACVNMVMVSGCR